MSFLNSPSEKGRLDASHLGMWINIDDIRAGNDEVLSHLVTQAMDHILTDEHRQFLENADIDTRISALGIFTVAAHESRHFHDMLLTPYGAAVISHHTRQAVTILSSMGSLMSNPAMVVPITEWTNLWPLLKDVDPSLKLPSPKLENLIAVLQETEDELRALDRGILHPNAPVTATQILESSAFWVQAGLAGTIPGKLEGSNLFVKSIVDSPARSRYLGAIEYIQSRLGPIPSAAVQWILLASLCGDVFNVSPGALRSPADVLFELVEWIAKHQEFPRPAPTPDTKWDEEVDLIDILISEFFHRVWNSEVTEMMISASDHTYAFVEMWEQRISGKDNGSPTFAWLQNAVSVYSDFAEVSGRLIANFSMNPNWYFVDQYIDALPALPQPIMFLWSDYGFPTTPDLRDSFNIQQEIVIPHQKGIISNSNLAAMHAAFSANAYDDGQALRAATVISPKVHPQTTFPNEAFAFEMEKLDIESWQLYFDTFAPILRLLTKGPDGGLPGGIMVQPLQILGLNGTKFYSLSGLLETPPPFFSASDPN